MFPKQDDERINRLLRKVELILADCDEKPTVVFFPPNILDMDEATDTERPTDDTPIEGE